MPARETTRTALGILAILLLTISETVRYLHWNLDDAMIVFRVVRNLLDGHGWAFNPGERHNPITSVLSVIGTTILTPVAPSIPVAGHVLGAAGIALAAVSVFMMARRLGSLLPATLAGLAVVMVMARNDTWGLEGHLFAGLALLAAALWQSGRSPWIVLGLVVLARPDGLLLVALFVAADWWRSGRVPLRGVVQCAAVVAPWIAYSLVRFGQVFPDTLAAKIWQGESGYWGSGRIYLAALKAHVPRAFGLPLVVTIAAIAGAALLAWRRHAVALLVIFAVAQQAAYVALNVPGYHWYFSFLELMAVVVAGCAACVALTAIWRGGTRGTTAGLAMLVAWTAWRATTVAVGDDRMRDIRHEVYSQTITTIERTTPTPGTLATLEVGSLAFGTSRRVMDLTGLASANPEFVSGRHLDRFFADPPLLVLLHDPPWHFEVALTDDLRFPLLYSTRRAFPDAHFPMMLHERAVDRRRVTPDELEAAIAAGYPPPTTIDAAAFGGAVRLSGSCALDHVNGRLPGPSSVDGVVRGPLRLRGWAVNPVQDTIGPTTLVVLRHESGARWSMPAVRSPRRDVAGMYPGRTFEQAGYAANAQVAALPPGRYDLTIVVGEVDGSTSACPLPATLLLR